MRIRSTLAAVALGVGALLIGAPAMADTQPSTPSAPAAKPEPTQMNSEARPPREAGKSLIEAPGQVRKPRGAAETGGGLDSSDSGPAAGVFVLGGAALVATGGIGAVAYRRLRRQG